jgi:membrane protease YdiL (CAAX protease family)
MSAASALDVSRTEPAIRSSRFYRLGLFALFFACGIAVFLFGCNYYRIFPTNKNLAYEGGLAVTFLIAALLMRKSTRWGKYWQIAYAFFIASAVWFITTLVGGFGNWALRLTNGSESTPMGTAVGKVGEAIGTVTIILILNKLAGADLGSVFIRRGNLKWALLVGLAVLLNFATAALMASASQYTQLDLLGAVMLWGLVFSLANGFMEELWFRGILLGKLRSLIGPGAAILLTALLFSIMHAGGLYMSPAAMPFYLINLFTHGLAMGYLVFKMNNLWGACLYHAACDFWLFIVMAGGFTSG